MSYRCPILKAASRTRLMTVAASILLSICVPPLNTGFGQESSAVVDGAHVADATSPSPAVEPTDAQIRQLAELLTGSRWTGRFTTLDADGQLGAAKDESYEILDAKKLPVGADGVDGPDGPNPNLWLLTTRIKYGKRDVTVPLPIEIRWAGGTPVITVDRLAIPGMGTFDARVLIRRGRYSGTWSHGEKGGHLFGLIGRADADEKDDNQE